MRGLLLKDLYILKGYAKQYTLIFLFLLIWSVMVQSFSFMTIYVVIIGSSLVMSTMSLDEAVSFNRFILAAPVNMRQIVKSKYALLVLTVGGGIAISTLLNLCIYLSPAGTDSFFSWDGFGAIVTLFLLANAVSLPAMFRFGVEKARYINICALFFVAIITFGIFYLGGGALERELEKFSNDIFGILLIAIGGLALVISYFVSIRIVKKKGL